MTTGYSWLRVGLDTTPPELKIFMPNITTNDSIEEITITSNENLDTLQEIFIVDSQGTRHNLTFALQQDRKTFFGRISFQNFPKGMSTLFVTLYDEVWNKSSLYKTNIHVVEPQNIRLYLSEYINELKLEIVKRELTTSSQEFSLYTSSHIMPIFTSDTLEEGDRL